MVLHNHVDKVLFHEGLRGVMKILYLHQYFRTPNEAGGTRSYEMARRLARFGHEVHIISSNIDVETADTSKWEVTKIEEIYIHQINLPYSNKLPYKERIKKFLTFAFRSAIYASKIPADVILATSTPLTIALPGIYIARRQKIPMVFEVRDLWPELPIAMGAIKGPSAYMAKLLEIFAYRNSAHIIALSPDMKKGISKTGYPESRIHVIPNGSDLDLFDVSAKEKKAFREKFSWLGSNPLVLYAGTIGKINGLEYMVWLAKETLLHDPRIKFLVIGDGAEKEKVRNIAQNEGVFGINFFMLDPMPKNEVAVAFATADLSLSLFIDLKEMWANSANKFFDSLAAGTPVAINYRGWQADLIKHTGAGILLDPRDINYSADTLVRFLNDKSALEKAADAARRLAEEKFDRNKLARELESVLLMAHGEKKSK